jgi:hypothetical protein
MAYQLLTGKMPFEGNQYQIMYKHRYTDPAPPSQINAALSQDIDMVIMRALAKDPQQRFSNVQEFVSALEQAQQHTREAQLATTQIAKPKQSERKLDLARYSFVLALLFGCVTGGLSSLTILTSFAIAGLLIGTPLLSLLAGGVTGKLTKKWITGFTTGIITGIVYFICIKMYTLRTVNPTETYTISIRMLQSLALRNVIMPISIIALICGLSGLLGSWLMTRTSATKSNSSYSLPQGRKKYALLIGGLAGAICSVTVFTRWDILGLLILCPILSIAVGIIAGKVAIQRSTGFVSGMVMGGVYILAIAVAQGESYTQGFLNGYGSTNVHSLAMILGVYLLVTVVEIVVVNSLFGLFSLFGAWLITLRHPYYISSTRP